MRATLAIWAIFMATIEASPVVAQGARSDGPQVTRGAAHSPRPLLRPAETGGGPVPMTARSGNLAFERWLDGFAGRAEAGGIRRDVLAAALTGLRYNTEIVARDRNQSEFSKALWDYLDSAVSATRIRNGQDMLTRHAGLLDRIEAAYGVEREIVVAIWGLESAYGAYRGRARVIEALATLAFDGRRGAFFEEQLLAALQIVQAGDVAPQEMTGSWAGAMGHTQFIPTSYLAYAVDFSGDGRRDIWSDDPSDALASAAAYLARFGWRTGQPWGVEVRLPQGFDHTLADGRTGSASDWAAQGVTAADGGALPDHGPAEILLPAGAAGPALMIFGNFRVIERYNTADSYVIAVGHLADRLRGEPAFRQDWPRGDRALLQSERAELQRRLTEAGFSTRGIDGRIGPNTIAAIRAYQLAEGLVPDGYASVRLLDRLR